MKSGYFKALLPPGAANLTFRQIPVALLKAVLLGTIAGPVLAFVPGWLFQTGSADMGNDRLAWLLHSAKGGIVYALAFYVFCGVPIGYVRWRFNDGSRTANAVVTLTGFVGGILAFVIVIAVLNPAYMGIRFRSGFIAGVVAMFLTVIASVLDRLRIEKALATSLAESKALQSQINPHFFFNTLNTISALIPVDPAAAQHTLGLFANMSRYAFVGMQTPQVPLVQELEFATDYVEIEKIRFGDRLRVEFHVAPRIEDIRVPALTLQPLIENAIRHGIAKRMGGGAVSIHVERSETQFSLRVENEIESSIGLSQSEFFKSGHALGNIRERLRLAYGNETSIQASFSDSNIVMVTIQAPIHP